MKVTHGYRPELDGVRGLAIILVVGYNAHWGIGAGYIGVDLFFVLSGYLITMLLLREFDRNGRVSFSRFYARRFLRLIPALAFLLTLYFILGTFFSNAPQDFWLGSLAAMFYSTNWVMAIGGSEGGMLMGPIAHTWSLSVEEQFYLLWPALLVFLLNRRIPRRRIAWVCAGIFVLALALRLWLVHKGVHPFRIYTGTDTRADALMAGCMLALLSREKDSVESTPWATISAAALTAIVALGFLLPLDNSPFMQRFGFSGVAVLCAGLIVALNGNRTSATSRLLSARPLAVVGKVSYGIYLWHVPIVHFLDEKTDLGGVRLMAVKLLAIALAVGFSWYVIERPALRLKKRFSPA